MKGLYAPFANQQGFTGMKRKPLLGHGFQNEFGDEFGIDRPDPYGVGVNKVKSTKVKKKIPVNYSTKLKVKPTRIDPVGIKTVKVTRVNPNTVNSTDTVVRVNPNTGQTQAVQNGGGVTSSIFSLVSQWISGNSRNSTVQTIGGQIPLYANTGEQVETQTGEVVNGVVNGVGGGVGQTVGGTVGGGLDGLFQFAQNNLGLVAAAMFGGYLLFRSPPKYGNK